MKYLIPLLLPALLFAAQPKNVQKDPSTNIPTESITDALLLYPNRAMGALEVNVAKRVNTKSISTDSTLTFSATASTGAIFGLVLTNSDSSSHVITIPSSYSLALADDITTFTIPADTTIEITWRYNGTTYFLAGEPFTIADLTTGTVATASAVPINVAGVDGKTTVANILALAPVTFVLTVDDVADSLNYGVGFVGAAFTVTEIRAVHTGSGLSSPSIIATVKHGTNRTSGTTIEAVTAISSTTGTSVTSGFDDATVPANSWIWVETSSKSGTTDNFEIVVRGTYD